uniref:Xaa-Pro aminopeptidase 1 n=1 Tax=Schistocephalus solidus TaxID=70667 RepID=A0A183T986_SCHSO
LPRVLSGAFSIMRKLDSSPRLARLRTELRKRNLDAYFLPMEDSHFNEYLAAADKRIAFISGFSGSAGTAVITMDEAALWTDGRYHDQAAQELDENWTLMREGLPEVPKLTDWLVQTTPPAARIGFDPQQLLFFAVETNVRDLAQAEAVISSGAAPRQLIPVTGANLVDCVWENWEDAANQRPPRPHQPISSVPVTFAGQTWQEKLDNLRTQMARENVGAVVVFALDEIAWLLNLRGDDISHNPVFFAYLVVTRDVLHVFIDAEREAGSVDLAEYFSCDSHKVELHAYGDFFGWMSELKGNRAIAGAGRIWLAPTASYALMDAVPADLRFTEISPLSSAKAVKNEAELAGMRQSNLVDSLALCDFLAWLEDIKNPAQSPADSACDVGAGSSDLDHSVFNPCGVIADPPKVLNEATLANYLDRIRTAAEGCKGLSFSTISAIDENGAIIHYHVGDSPNPRPLTANSMYLVDSGGQYSTGTTDVTRTVHVGTPSAEQREDFTHVLKAHIGLATVLFPDGTAGTALDVVCRSQMWRARRNYLHGTGHGVGAHLCVHEGPIGLSGRRSQVLTRIGIQEPGIKKNMVVTIEPGYYLPGKYGIRLENVNIVVEAPSMSANVAPTSGPVAPTYLAFEPITLVPFQRKLIAHEMLTPAEIEWLDAYHDLVRRELIARIAHDAGDDGLLSPARQRTRDWLLRQTEPLKMSA